MDNPSNKNTAVVELRELQENILQKMDYLGVLNAQFKSKQER